MEKIVSTANIITTTSSSSELADFIKETHESLRTIFKENNDDDDEETLWIKHVQNKSHLKKYAQAMHILATEHWENKDNTSRIHWIHDSLVDYFFNGGLETKMEKENRKVRVTRENEINTFEKIRNMLEKYDSCRKLKVLDVGSCYNPFGRFGDMDVTPIDLQPATSDVFSCDFLSLKVVKCDESLHQLVKSEETSHQEISPNKQNFTPEETENKGRKRQITGDQESKKKAFVDPASQFQINQLNTESFDAVIFCLFLEYIPSPKLRFECCKKAYELLKPNGLLCIVTPDSKHNGANVHLFKMWKITLGNLGFNRINYHKSAHFHGMIFRKGLIATVWRNDASRELDEIQHKQLKAKFADINYGKIMESIFILREIQDLKL